MPSCVILSNNSRTMGVSSGKVIPNHLLGVDKTFTFTPLESIAPTSVGIRNSDLEFSKLPSARKLTNRFSSRSRTSGVNAHIFIETAILPSRCFTPPVSSTCGPSVDFMIFYVSKMLVRSPFLSVTHRPLVTPPNFLRVLVRRNPAMAYLPFVFSSRDSRNADIWR